MSQDFIYIIMMITTTVEAAAVDGASKYRFKGKRYH